MDPVKGNPSPCITSRRAAPDAVAPLLPLGNLRVQISPEPKNLERFQKIGTLI